MLNPPSLQPLAPQQYRLENGNTIYYFNNPSLDLVKLDFTFEAGSAYQQFKSQAHAANQLFAEATQLHSAQEVAEFMDFRGIVVERMADVIQGNVSFYFLRKYAAELLPLVREFFDAPAITAQLFDSYRAKRRQKIVQGFQQTDYRARNRFDELLFGSHHPLGTFALPEDVDKLTSEAVLDFIHQHYQLSNAHIVMAGQIDDELLGMADKCFSTAQYEAVTKLELPQPSAENNVSREHIVVPNAVQSSLRIGRILPLKWDDKDYSQFMVLCNVLGGYFGSRLMSNIREEKGYTYGIYSTTQIYRGSILFLIAADVAGQVTNAAVEEVLKEVQRLKDEQIGGEELERVRNVMMGDFIRNIDGTFEISERYRQMVPSGITDQFSVNYLDAIQHVTPAQLLQVARKYLNQLLVVTAGPELEK